MVKIEKLLFAFLACFLFSCQDEMENVQNEAQQLMKTVTLKTSMGQSDSRASIDSETGAFSWQSGDMISVLATDGKFYDFTLTEGAGKKEAEFSGSIPESSYITTVAAYPRIISNGSDNIILSGNTLNYTLPSTWTYAKDVSNVPMVAAFDPDATLVSFKQVGGVMRFPVKNLPPQATFVLTMKDKTITGAFPVNIAELGNAYMQAGSEESVLTINYSSDTDGAYAEFNVPVPVGTYNNFNVSIKDAEGNVLLSKDYVKDNKVNRATLLNMKELVLPTRPVLTSLSINGSVATSLDGKFVSVKLPYGTDVTALKPVFTTENGTVTINGSIMAGDVSVNFSSPVEFLLTAEDGGNKTYIVSISYSDLPVVYINTKDAAPIVSKENWLKGSEIYITNAGKYNAVYKESQIRGRGNTTWRMPKKPYAIKLDSKQEVLGMPKHKRWVLLANYVDKTCIRNSITFEIARRCEGLDWTPRGKHVDVVLNGVFLGNYYLCEQIKVDKNRVNITEMEVTDVDTESITGGYLLEIDKNYDEVNKFYSPVRNMPFMIKEPDEDVLGSEQLVYIQNHISEVENALYGTGSTTEGYLQYIDLDSFIDYWLVYELTGTGEPTHPKSVYMYKDRGGKIHAGPVWDFDYFTFQPYYKNCLINTRAVWNDRIINDPATLPVIKQRWNACRDDLRTIAEEIDRQYESIKASAEYNSLLWPLSDNINRDDALSVENAVARMKTYYVDKFNYMDTYINTNF